MHKRPSRGSQNQTGPDYRKFQDLRGSPDAIKHQTKTRTAREDQTSMPRPKSKETQECQTEAAADDKQWIKDQIQQGILIFANKFKEHYDDQITKLQKEIEDLKSTVSLLVSGTDALNNLQQRSEADIELLQDSVESIEENQAKTLTNVNKQFGESEKAMKSTEQRLDDLEQESKSNNIRIIGIAEEEGEDLKIKVTDLVENNHQVRNIEPEDIADIGRMGKHTNKVRDILVKFKCSALWNKIYNKRKLLHHDNNPIYINEDLTPQRSKLFFEARKLRKKEKIFGTWTQAGNIMVKVKDSDQPCVVKTYHELTKLIQDENQEQDQELS